MHAALQLLGLWALAFVTLGLAVALLNLFSGLIGSDLALHPVKKEAAIAGIASLLEGVSLWLVITFVPTAVRALIVPALIVGLLYKVSHLQDWSRYDVLLLLAFQLAIGGFAVALLAGRFATAATILSVFTVAFFVLGIIWKYFLD